LTLFDTDVEYYAGSIGETVSFDFPDKGLLEPDEGEPRNLIGTSPGIVGISKGCLGLEWTLRLH
jgi:hypothetical protein